MKKLKEKAMEKQATLKKEKRVKQNKNNAKNVILILEVIYLLQTILATIASINNDNISFIQMMWWPFLVNVLLIINYVLYVKKIKYSMLFEIFIAILMLMKVMIAIITKSPDILSLLLMLVYPIVLVIHALSVLKKYKK